MSELEQVRVSSVRCPYCHGDLERGSEPAVCPECHALHHEECLAEHGTCAACSASHPRYAEGAARQRERRASAAATTDKDAPAALEVETPADVATAEGERRFAYEAVNARGERKRGIVQAPDRDVAMELIQGTGLFPTRVKDVTTEDDLLLDNVFSDSTLRTLWITGLLALAGLALLLLLSNG